MNVKRGFLTAKNYIQGILEDDCPGLAAEMAYNWVLALMPLLIFLFALFGMLLPDSTMFPELLTYLRQMMPGEAYAVLANSLREVIQNTSGGLVIASLLGALWASSNGAMAVIKGLNRAYCCDEDSRPFWKKRLISIAIVLGMAIILLVLSVLLMFGNELIDWAVRMMGLNYDLAMFLSIVRWVVTISGLILITIYIYALAPAVEIPPRQWFKVWPGALLFIALWIAISWAFSLYVTNMGKYSQVYGAMGGIVIMMVWLYLTSFALLLGGELNGRRLGKST